MGVGGGEVRDWQMQALWGYVRLDKDAWLRVLAFRLETVRGRLSRFLKREQGRYAFPLQLGKLHSSWPVRLLPQSLFWKSATKQAVFLSENGQRQFCNLRRCYRIKFFLLRGCQTIPIVRASWVIMRQNIVYTNVSEDTVDMSVTFCLVMRCVVHTYQEIT